MYEYKIYEGQTGIAIILDCKTDVSEAIQWKVYYKKPDGSFGNVAANLVQDSLEDIYFVIHQSSFLDQTGVWKFWSWVYWDSDTIGKGDVDKVRVYRVGT